MLGRLNPKVLGSVVVGVALVAGAYTISNFGEPRMQQPASVLESQAPERVAIAVTDKDENGVEDWRDQLIPTQPAAMITSSTSYELPTTLTGKMSISLLENYTQSKINGPFGNTQDEVVSQALDELSEGTRQELYDTKDVIVMETWTDEDIKNYANAMAGAILNNNVKGVKQEVAIMYEAVVKGDTKKIEDLAVVTDIYKRTLDDSLAVPVPALLLKQHLDLINSYSALYGDVDAMAKTFSDPAATLMRFKRYQDDTLGLRLSLENMYVSLTPYENLFGTSDSAIFFTSFNPSNNRVQ
jgi:hypothetical protein